MLDTKPEAERLAGAAARGRGSRAGGNRRCRRAAHKTTPAGKRRPRKARASVMVGSALGG
jgi:hypothetical protein